MDNDSFTSILLALITLCATLAVVIPYVVGKSISKDDIRKMVDENMDRYNDRSALDYIACASKYKQYMGNDATASQFKEQFRNDLKMD